MRRLILSVLALLCAACTQPSAEKLVVLSERFETCIRLPNAANYRHVAKGVDYDIGELRIGSDSIQVYTGPGVGFRSKAASDGATKLRVKGEDFVFVADQDEQGIRKVLLGQKRFERRGPLFVMFQGNAKEVEAIEAAIKSKDFLSYCEVLRAGGADQDRWREPSL